MEKLNLDNNMDEEASTTSAIPEVEGKFSSDGNSEMNVDILVSSPGISAPNVSGPDVSPPDVLLVDEQVENNSALEKVQITVITPSKDDQAEVTTDVITATSVEESIEGEQKEELSTKDEKKKKERPMSAAMQRLTAKKGESPDAARKNQLSTEQRKEKANEVRKKKILENRSKEDDRRAAVLERKKKLDEAERQRKEALFKKLTSDSVQKPNPIAIKKRYSVSTSNLAQLKKNKPIEREINLDVPDNGETLESKSQTKTKAPERPRSAMQRTKPASTSNLKPKSKPSPEKPDFKRPMTANPTMNKSSKVSKQPTRLSLNPRPATALGISAVDRRKTLDVTGAPKKKTGPVKTSSTSNLAKDAKPKTAAPTKTLPTADKKVIDKKPADKKPTAVSTTTTEKSRLSSAKTTPVKSAASKPKPLATAAKKDGAVKPKTTTPKADGKSKADTPKTKSETKKKSGSSKPTPAAQMTEEEAKKALAERRKKAKEEAEEKARIEREKDEVARQEREAEELRLAEELKLEEERQVALMEQLKKEEEERKVKMIEEKEQKDEEEKTRLEQEQKEREEEMDRKTKLEIEKLQKEQEKKEQELDAERIERKKRVEMIMARVSAKRGDSEGGDISTDNIATTPPKEEIDGSARLKADDILKSKGLYRSSEDLLKENNEEEQTVNTEQTLEQTVNTEITNNNIETDNKGNSVNIEEIICYNKGVEERAVNTETTQVVNSENVDGSIVTTTTTIESIVNDQPISESVVVDHPISESIVIDQPISGSTLSDQPITINLIDSPSVEQLDTPNEEKSPINEDSDGITTTSTTHVNDVNNVVDNDVNKAINVNVTLEDEKHNKLSNGESNSSHDNLLNENDQWNILEERMKTMSVNSPSSQQPMAEGEEGKLWKVMEGKVELSECF